MKPCDDSEINWGLGDPKIQSRGILEGGGGSSSFTRPTSREIFYTADFVLALHHKGYFETLKDRSGNRGKITLDEAVEKIADMLATVKFEKSMDLFQESTRLKLIEVINEVLSGKNIVPEGVIDEDTIQPESTRNGVRHNSLLQRFISLRR